MLARCDDFSAADARSLSSSSVVKSTMEDRSNGERVSTVGVRLGRAMLLAVLVCWDGIAGADPIPLVRAHAHNDYLHSRPLLDALDHGFCSVEADIHLVDGKLLVAHDRALVKPEHTLQALYLDPLRERVKKNRGKVYLGGPEFSLLIDLKSNWQTTYPALRDVLKGYADMLTTFKAGSKQSNAVTIIISGSRSLKMFEEEKVRYAAYDGQLPDLGSGEPASLIAWISSSWGTAFKWRGVGPFPTDEREKLGQIVSQAHEQGRRVRFWGAPDNPVFWGEMFTNKVDLINTDNLPGLKEFLLEVDTGRRGEGQ
jgi:hypothetical protein